MQIVCSWHFLLNVVLESVWFHHWEAMRRLSKRVAGLQMAVPAMLFCVIVGTTSRLSSWRTTEIWEGMLFNACQQNSWNRHQVHKCEGVILCLCRWDWLWSITTRSQCMEWGVGSSRCFWWVWTTKQTSFGRAHSGSVTGQHLHHLWCCCLGFASHYIVVIVFVFGNCFSHYTKY